MRRASGIRRRSASQNAAGLSNIIGERLRAVRQARGLTLQETCDRFEAASGFTVHQTTLTRIELGSRSVYDFEVVALGQALQVDVRYLLGLIDNPLPGQ